MQTILITGSSSGYGLETARHFLANGWNVIATMRRPDEDALPRSKQLRVLPLDVTSEDSIAAAIKAAGPIDVLVNNAGITRDGFFHKMSHEQWGDVIRVNMDSCFNMTRQVIEGMRARGFGRIVNISSINGQKGQAGQVNYSAAKAGMIGFTKALAQESASKGITVNCVAPGYIDTDMVAAVPEEAMKKIISTIPVGRLGKAEEIAGAVSFLASDDAGYMTGSTLTMNGAQYIV